MADPQHVPELDGFDRLTVGLYRSGLTLAAAGVLAAGVVHLAAAAGPGLEALRTALSAVWWAIGLGTALAVLDMHLYDKRIRWFIQASAWLGLLLQISAGLVAPELGRWLFHAGLGFVFVALSGFALKEQFCFRIPGLRLVPLMLAASLVPLLAGWPSAAGGLLAVAGLVYLILAIAKWRMPLHFDVGDKSRYQI